MKYKASGEPLKITRSDVADIQRVAHMQNQRVTVDTDVVGDDYVLIQNKTNESIAAYSVVGITAVEPREALIGVYNVITEVLTYLELDVVETQLPNDYKLAAMPTYRNNQGLYGVLDQPLRPNDCGRVRINGYAIAWVNVLQEIQASGSSAQEFYNLRPAELRSQMDPKPGGLAVPFVVGTDIDGATSGIGVTQRIHGSAHIVQPSSQRWTVQDTDADPVYKILPRGLQLMRVWLGTSNPKAWAELYSGILETV